MRIKRGIPDRNYQVSVRLAFKLIDGQNLSTTVDKSSFTVGRSSKCDVVIPNEGLSREHCLIEIDGGEVFITDFGSANGVLIDDQKIPANQRTSYNPSFSLSLGSIEVVKFDVESPKDAIELDFPDRSATAQSSPSSSSQAAARENVVSKRKGAADSGSGLHPGLKGMIFIAIVAVGYFLFQKITGESESENDEYSRMLYESKMKGKSNDGSVGTRNF